MNDLLREHSFHSTSIKRMYGFVSVFLSNPKSVKIQGRDYIPLKVFVFVFKTKCLGFQ